MARTASLSEGLAVVDIIQLKPKEKRNGFPSGDINYDQLYSETDNKARPLPQYVLSRDKGLP